jgi:hypothetical protein
VTLPHRQERLLRDADYALCRSDPELASMLTIFARITAAEGMPAREQLRPQPTGAWRALLWSVGAVVFLAAFVVVFVAGGGSKAATACGASCSHRLSGRVIGRNGPF